MTPIFELIQTLSVKHVRGCEQHPNHALRSAPPLRYVRSPCPKPQSERRLIRAASRLALPSLGSVVAVRRRLKISAYQIRPEWRPRARMTDCQMWRRREREREGTKHFRTRNTGDWIFSVDNFEKKQNCVNASVLMQTLSYPTLSNKITRDRIVLSFKESP